VEGLSAHQESDDFAAAEGAADSALPVYVPLPFDGELFRPAASTTQPPVTTRDVPEETIPERDEQPRVTASPRFQLEYELLEMGPSRATRVELWYTQDRGQTWQLLAADPDQQSPIDVEMPREGLFGFSLAVYSDDARAPRPPQDQDPADIWVVVDWTKPVARLTSARYGTGIGRDILEIHWQASDALLVDRPITLLFSESPAGPWTTIASGLPNTGSYEWRVDQRTPRQLYLQLEVRDRAGNTTLHQLDRPVSTESVAPRARIRGVRPLDARQPPG
jgi:hypothetical protein